MKNKNEEKIEYYPLPIEVLCKIKDISIFHFANSNSNDVDNEKINKKYNGNIE